jgi:LacI family transcriptional regulator, galactose operon repressor
MGDVTRQPTSHDVARLAGVSQPTVSRSLRDGARVAESTRRRVFEAAASLGYVPSRRGRNLSTRATGHVGVVVSDLTNPFYVETIAHLHRALAGVGVRMVVLTDEQERTLEAEPLFDGSLDGAILTTMLVDSTLPRALQARGFPFVLLNREVDGVNADACVSENAIGARRVAEELVRLGHHDVGALFGPANTSTGREREAGFRAALSEHGIALAPTRWRRGPFTTDAGHTGLLDLLDAADPPTAVFCSNDVIALGALNAARSRGLSIPDDLSVIGFDDIGMAAWEVFALTTVRQDMAQMAERAAELLVSRIAEPERPPRRLELPTPIVARESHARRRR